MIVVLPRLFDEATHTLYGEMFPLGLCWRLLILDTALSCVVNEISQIRSGPTLFCNLAVAPR